jgi:hypothetical protein
MAPKDFWKDKHLHDQYNERNPGQANHPDSQRKSEKESPPSPTPAAPQKERDPEKKK